LTDVSEVLIVSIIAFMVAAVSTSEMSVNIYQTTRPNIPEDSHLHSRRRENLKSHSILCSSNAVLEFLVGLTVELFRNDFCAWTAVLSAVLFAFGRLQL
jgi:hypothetical protein